LLQTNIAQTRATFLVFRLDGKLNAQATDEIDDRVDPERSELAAAMERMPSSSRAKMRAYREAGGGTTWYAGEKSNGHACPDAACNGDV
jgi:hypothetical protein